MSRNFAELERELIADLMPRTGRDLGQWMAAIDAAGLTDKNAIIDWLRPQGFNFAQASWLERIHNNGGRPIYLGGGPPAAAPAARIEPARGNAGVHVPAPAQPRPATSAPPASDPARSDPQSVPLNQLLARAKAYRPLAEMVIGHLERGLAGVSTTVEGELVAFRRPELLALLLATPREVRLALDLGEHPFEPPLQRGRLPGADRRFAHLVILNDARQVGPELLELVRLADARANAAPGTL